MTTGGSFLFLNLNLQLLVTCACESVLLTSKRRRDHRPPGPFLFLRQMKMIYLAWFSRHLAVLRAIKKSVQIIIMRQICNYRCRYKCTFILRASWSLVPEPSLGCWWRRGDVCPFLDRCVLLKRRTRWPPPSPLSSMPSRAAPVRTSLITQLGRRLLRRRTRVPRQRAAPPLMRPFPRPRLPARTVLLPTLAQWVSGPLSSRKRWRNGVGSPQPGKP